MNKNEFLQTLKKRLAGLPEEEIGKAVDYYSEMIDDALEDGADEAEVINRLGEIEDIVSEIIDKTPIRKLIKEKFRRMKQVSEAREVKPRTDKSPKKLPVLIILLLIIGSPVWVSIITALFSVIVSLYLTIWAIVAAIFICAIAFAICSPACFVMAIVFLFMTPAKALFALGCALFLAGLAILVGILSVACVKLTIKLTVFIMRQIKNLFIRKGA